MLLERYVAVLQTPSHVVASLIHLAKPFPTPIIAVSFGRMCFLWPRLWVKSAASVFALRTGSTVLK